MSFGSATSVESPAFVRKSTGTTKVGHTYGTLAQRLGVTIDAKYDYDFKGDGTDETAKLQAAVDAAAYGTLIIRKHGASPYQVLGVNINYPVQIIVHNDAIIKPYLSGSGGKVFNILSSGVKIHGYWSLSGNGVTQTQTGNTYGIIAQHTSTIEDLEIDGVSIEEWEFTDDPLDDLSIIVAHGIYLDDAERAKLKIKADTLSGAGIFCNDVVDLEVKGGKLKDCLWYPMHLKAGCQNFVIDQLRVDTQNSLGSYWGGLIDLMSIQTGNRNNIGTVKNCILRGLASYGSVIRCSSSEQVTFENNDINVGVGSLAASSVLSHYRVNTRGISTAAENGPCKNITIRGGLLKAASANAMGVYISNEWQTARTPAKRIAIEGVEIESPDSSNYFGAFAQVHGQSGGFENVKIEGNKGSVRSIGQTRTVGGIVGFVATDANGKIVNSDVSANHFINEGTAINSSDVGCYIGAYADEVRAPKPNTWDGMYYDVRTVTNSGPTIEYFDDDFSRNNVSGTKFLNGVAQSRIRQTNESGTTAQRPASGGGRENYVIRFNTTQDCFEYWDGNAWVFLRGSEDGTHNVTSTELADIGDTINTRNKYANKVVRNTTDGKRYFSNGALAADIWITADGGTSITPV